jgi:hypothetical protein
MIPAWVAIYQQHLHVSIRVGQAAWCCQLGGLEDGHGQQPTLEVIDVADELARPACFRRVINVLDDMEMRVA